MGDLAAGVHARISASGRPQPHRGAEDDSQRRIEIARDRALPLVQPSPLKIGVMKRYRAETDNAT